MSSGQPPRILGRYEVVRSLGRGAVGEVFLVRDPALNRQVAVKTLSGLDALPPAERDEAKARFLREARAAAGLSHPHIVTIYDVGEADGVPFIAMEYIQATSLDRFIQEGHRLPAPKVLELGIQAAAALEEAHRRGIVHRDVKPANLALMADGSLKVVDFGLAKGAESHLTAADTILGTPNYMSPEQIAGKEIDGRSDMFSLAVTLFELLTGQRPFGGDTLSSVLYRIVNDPPLPLTDVRPDLPPGLENLLARALAKDPARRPASCAEFAQQIQLILGAMGGVPANLRIPSPADASPPPPTIPTPARRRGWLVPAAVVFVIAAAVGAMWFTPLGAALGIVSREAVVGIETAPPGLPIRVTGGGARLGAPGQLLIPRAAHEPVRVEASDDCRAGEVTLDPKSLPERATVSTQPRLASAEATTDPPGAAVSVDGKKVSDATPVDLSLALCTAHTIELSAPGRASATIQLDAGASLAEWRAKLENVPLPALVEPPRTGEVLIAAPPGYTADVVVAASGRRLGAAGRPITLAAGQHQLLLVNRDVLLRVPLRVEAAAGGETRAPVAWPKLGFLTVRAAPPGGRVFARLPGEDEPAEIGVTPINKMPVVEGAYELILEHPTSGKRVVRNVAVAAGAEAPAVRVGQEDWR